MDGVKRMGGGGMRNHEESVRDFNPNTKRDFSNWRDLQGFSMFSGLTVGELITVLSKCDQGLPVGFINDYGEFVGFSLSNVCVEADRVRLTNTHFRSEL